MYIFWHFILFLFYFIVYHIYRQFSPIPTLPLKTLEIPNPPPGAWRSMIMNVHIVSRFKPEGSFGYWLISKDIGSIVNVTKPHGTLFVPMFYEIKYLHIITAGTAITAILELILNILQMSQWVKIKSYFIRYEKIHLWNNNFILVLWSICVLCCIVNLNDFSTQS